MFFIGDGLTGTGIGSVQVFHVPATATHLYLGFVETCRITGDATPGCYENDQGSVTATFSLRRENWLHLPLSSAPSPRCCSGMAYGGAAMGTVLFGGGNGGILPRQRFGDTWTWKGTWVQQAPTMSPSPRQGSVMAYDPIARTVLLFGGGDVNGQYLGDTWLWDGTGWTQQFPPLSPAGRKFDAQTLAYNVATGTILLFGGTNASGVLNDTWEWDGKTNTWTQRFPASSPSPRNTTLAYDPRRSQVVLFGGSNAKGDCCSSYYNDTWTWDGQNWTQQFPVSSPPTRVHPAMVYDPNIGATIIYGGFHTPGVGLFDTWSWDGSNWTQLQTLTNPGGRWAMGSVFDSLANAPLIFGGEITGDPFSNQTWILTP